MTNVVFMGTPAFSVPILEGLIEEGYTIQAVVTQPDRPVGRKRIVTSPPVKIAALEHQLLVLQPEKIAGSHEMQRIIELAPDIIVTAAFGQFLPEALLHAAKIKALNVHASLLPKYRGGAPVHYAIMNGEETTGVTIMEMIKKMDAGGIYAQASVPIRSTDDVGDLFQTLSSVGRQLLLDTLPNIINGQLQPTPQVESEATFSPNITREQEAVDWGKTASEIDCQIRGMRPWPIAFTMHEATRWKLWAARPVEETTNDVPGTIVKRTKKELWIACGSGTILALEEVQPAGKSKQSIAAFLNGAGQQIAVGQQVQ